MLEMDSPVNSRRSRRKSQVQLVSSFGHSSKKNRKGGPYLFASDLDFDYTLVMVLKLSINFTNMPLFIDKDNSIMRGNNVFLMSGDILLK